MLFLRFIIKLKMILALMKGNKLAIDLIRIREIREFLYAVTEKPRRF
jgi:hypothetical protein